MNKKDLNTLYFCAFRYALGHMTYMVSTVTDLLIKAAKDGTLDEVNRDLMTREIRKALDAGKIEMPCDRVDWQRLLNVLKECR